MPIEARHEEAQFDLGQMLDTGRVLWPTYFQLAAMTFAWNASLGGGATFVFLRGGGEPTEAVFHLYAGILIGVIGVVYNLGALSAYILMDKIHQQMIEAISHFREPFGELQIVSLLSRFSMRGRLRLLYKLTLLFFTTLSVGWLFYVASVVSRFHVT